jgi:hypothetical protein
MTYYATTPQGSNGTFGNVTLTTAGGIAGTGAVSGTINITNGGSGYTLGASPTTAYTIAGSNGYNYTTGASTYWNAPSTSPLNITSTEMNCPKDYDIKLGDMSLKDTLTAINKWLPILKPNVKLEADFDELKRLRQQYEALEKELMDKAEMWDLLKKE